MRGSTSFGFFPAGFDGRLMALSDPDGDSVLTLFVRADLKSASPIDGPNGTGVLVIVAASVPQFELLI